MLANVTMEAPIGSCIGDFAKDVIDVAKKLNQNVNGKFNDRIITATPESNPKELMEAYFKQFRRQTYFEYIQEKTKIDSEFLRAIFKYLATSRAVNVYHFDKTGIKTTYSFSYGKSGSVWVRRVFENGYTDPELTLAFQIEQLHREMSPI